MVGGMATVMATMYEKAACPGSSPASSDYSRHEHSLRVRLGVRDTCPSRRKSAH